MLSPIQTRRHWIRKFALEAHDISGENGMSDSQFRMAHWKCENHWHVRLRVTLKNKDSEKPARYSGEVEYEGIFEIASGYPGDKVEKLVRINGGVILYGAIRELILATAARSTHGPFEIPTIDARMFLEEVDTAKTGQTDDETRVAAESQTKPRGESDSD